MMEDAVQRRKSIGRNDVEDAQLKRGANVEMREALGFQ
jgi:hypothetical protein